MHDTLLIVFTGVLAFAVLMQSLLFYGIYRSIRQISGWMDGAGKDLLKHVEAISAKVEEGLATIKGIAEGLKPIEENLANTAAIVHKRVLDVDHFLAEATGAARLEIAQIQDTVRAASRRIEQTLEHLHNSIVIPLNEATAITRAIRVGMDVFLGRRRNPGRATAQDEEMFI